MTYRIHMFLAAGWRRRYLILTPMLILPILGFKVGSSGQLNYVSHTTILIQETAKINPFLEDFSVSPDLKNRMMSLKTLVKSRFVMTNVAMDLGLFTEEDEPAKKDYIIGQLAGRLSVSQAGADMIRLGYQSNDPSNMKEVLETVSKHFLEQILAPERSSMDSSTTFLGNQLEMRREELLVSEIALENFKAEHADALPAQHGANVNRLRTMRESLNNREAELAGAERALQSFQKRLAGTNPVVGKLEDEIISIRAQLVLFRARYTDEHSAVQAARRKLASLEEERQRILAEPVEESDPDRLFDMASSMQSGLDGEGGGNMLLAGQLEEYQLAQSKVASLTEQVNRFRAMVDQLNKETQEFGRHERELRELERDLKVKQKLYDDLLQRFERARVTSSLGKFEGPERVKIIDRPYTPSIPTNAPAVVFVIGGIVGGLFLGIGLAVVLNLMDTSIARVETLRTTAGVPVLGSMPPLDPVDPTWSTVKLFRAILLKPFTLLRDLVLRLVDMFRRKPA